MEKDDLHNRVRVFENIHIPLWLIKDTCWMMEWKTLGIIMIIPTVLVAFWIAIRTYGEKLFYINLAICFWISANSFWMCCEFFGRVDLKNYAAIPFVLGMISTAIYYLLTYKENQKTPIV